jgi:ATP-dependent DNA ligase
LVLAKGTPVDICIATAMIPLKGRFPAMSLAINPPLAPMEAREADELPSGTGWQYEPKWDGFRCLAYRDGRTVVLQAKSGEPLTRYFPEVVMAIAALPGARFVLDGEIVVIGEGSRLSHDDLAQRIHPSARKVAQLSARTPATFLAFDLLAEGDDSLLPRPLAERRARLERFFKGARIDGVGLSPASGKKAEAVAWLRDLASAGIDGVVAKRKDAAYEPGAREAMVKFRVTRTLDCVVGGVRRSGEGPAAQATLLLGLHDDEGLLHYVGTTAPLAAAAIKGLDKLVTPLLQPPGFTGRQPPSRPVVSSAPRPPSSAARPRDFEPLRPALTVEVRYDRFTADQFRGNPVLVRFRPDKKPAQCTFDALRPPRAVKGQGLERIGL